MAEQRLNVIFSADGSQMVKTLDQLEAELKQFKDQLTGTLSSDQFRKLTQDIAKTEAQIKSLKSAGAGLRPVLNNAGQGLKTLTTSSNQATQSMINLGRVVQDAPFGFLGIANNLNPLLESFQRLKQSTGSTGGAIKALVNSLGGAGGLGFALSLVSSALILFGDKLFGSTQKAKENKEALDQLKASIQAVKDETVSLTNAIAFANQLGAINVQIFGQGDLEDLRQQSLANIELIENLNQKTLTAEKNYSAALKIVQGKRNDDTEALEKEALSALAEAHGKEADARKTQRLLYRRIELQKVKDAKDAQQKALADQQKALADYEKYVNDMISRGKEFAKFFDGLLIVPQFTIFDSKQEAFAKAKKFLDELTAGLFKIKMPDWKITPNIIIQANEIPVIIEPVFNQKTQDAFFEDLKKKFQEKYKVDLSIDIAKVRVEFKKAFDDAVKSGGLREALDAFQKELKDSQGKGRGVFVELKDDIKNAAIAMNDILTPAFTEFFDAIIEGENPIKAFFDSIVQSINQVIRKLIQAAIQAAILSAITGTNFGGNFLKGLSGLLGGGGIAAPNFRGGGSIAFRLDSRVEFIQRGSDLIGVLNQGNALLGRVG